MKLLIKDCVHVKNHLYCISQEYNLVFSYDLIGGKVELLVYIPEEYANKSDLMGAIDYYDGKLLILPNNSENIWVYSISDKSLFKIERERIPHYGSGGMLQVVKKNNYI